MEYRIYIKNMVCNRCLEAVTEELHRCNIKPLNIGLGEVTLVQDLTPETKSHLKDALEKRGFELLEDRNSRIIEQIKNLLIEVIHRREEPLNVNYSTFIEKEIGKEYHYLSTLFSSVEGITMERYIILQKLEKVKELLIYDELNLSQIAYKLGYSSVQHLSNQFKKNTGMPPSEFKKRQTGRRNPIDRLTP